MSPSPHFPARERAVPALGAELRRVDYPLGVWVDNGQVRVGPWLQGAFLDAQNAGRVDGELLDHFRPVEEARFDEAVYAHRDERFEADDSKGRLVQLAGLLL